MGLKIECLFFPWEGGFGVVMASCLQLFYVKDQCRMMYTVMICIPIQCFSINLLVLVF